MGRPPKHQAILTKLGWAYAGVYKIVRLNGEPLQPQRSWASLESAWAFRSATRWRCSSVNSTLLALSRSINRPPTIEPIATTKINQAYHGIGLSLRQQTVGNFPR